MGFKIEWVIQPPRPERPEDFRGALCLGDEGGGEDGRAWLPPRGELGEVWLRDGRSSSPDREEFPFEPRLDRLGWVVCRGAVSCAGDCLPSFRSRLDSLAGSEMAFLERVRLRFLVRLCVPG
jgi:hypothetical protein